MEPLTKAEINTLIFALEDMLRNREFEEAQVEKIAALRDKLTVMYTSLAREETKSVDSVKRTLIDS